MPTQATILIVEDDLIIQRLLDQTLAAEGFQLVHENDGARVLSRAVELKPDLILLDVMLPHTDGFELCRQLRHEAVLGTVPIIILTSLVDDESRLKGLEAGADEFLTKPFKKAELQVRVRTVTQLQRYRSLAAERSQFEKIIELSPDGTLVVDAQARIQLANPAMRRMLSCPQDSLPVRDAFSLIPESHHARFKQCLATLLVDKVHVDSFEIELSTTQGHVFPAELTARHFPWEEQACIQINVRNVSEKKKLEKELLRMQRMQSIGTLAGGIAHDLNNALTPITLASQLARSELKGHPATRFLDTIEKSTTRGVSIIKQILAFARGVEGQREVIHLPTLLKEIEKILQQTFPANIRIQADLAPELWPVRGDATQLHQVVTNLCVNARDAMPNGGVLHVRAANSTMDQLQAHATSGAKAGPYVQITVSDTGTGIPPAVLDKIFEPFFTTKEIGKGTGLGLSSAMGIVKSHQGFMTVESEPGKGSKFHVFLPPVAAGSNQVSTRPPSELLRGRGELLLVADDDTEIRETIRQTLETHGYRVITAADGTEAVALFARRQGEIKAVLVDYMMPVLDGIATVRALRKLQPQIPVTMMTGHTERERLEQYAAQSNTRLLIKPFSMEILLEAIQKRLQAGEGILPPG